ncbi:MAG: hypothetical protein HZA92_05545 [Verrucomicrobia bacterium]|nr:hypothetical protein [Verrucomicrobiota bacterium]
MSTAVLAKPSARRAKPAAKPAVLRLLETWSRESDYDSRAWPRVRRSLAVNRLSARPALNE